MDNKIYKVKDAIEAYWKKEIWDEDEDEDEDEIVIEGIFEKAAHAYNREEVIIILKDQEDEDYKLYCSIDWEDEETKQNIKKYKYNDRIRIGSFWASPSKDHKILALELCSVYEREDAEITNSTQLNGTGNKTLWWKSGRLYLLDTTNTGSIYAIAGDDGIEELIPGKEKPIIFKVHNEVIYYANVKNKAQLLCYNITSKKRDVILRESSIGDFQLWDKFIFVVVQKTFKRCLYQIDLTNMNRLVITEGALSFTIVDKCYHGDKQYQGQFCCYDITDKKSIFVSKSLFKIKLQYYKGKVYYVDYYRKGIYALNLKTLEENLVIEGEISEYSCYEGIIYYIRKDDKNIYGISIEGRKIGKIVAKEAKNLNISSGVLDYVDCRNNERKSIPLDEIKGD